MRQARRRTPGRQAKTPPDFVYTNLGGPVSPESKDGFNYALSFVHDYSGMIMIYFLKSKSDSVEATKQFLAEEKPLGKVICIRSDNGGEFVGHTFKSLLRNSKIKHET